MTMILSRGVCGGQRVLSPKAITTMLDSGVAFVLMADIGDFLVRTPLLEELGSAIVQTLLNQPAEKLTPATRRRMRQAALNFAYAIFLGISTLAWFPHRHSRRPIGALLYHAVLPTALMFGVRRASRTPWPWLFRFAPDAVSVLTLGCLSLGAAGLTPAASTRSGRS